MLSQASKKVDYQGSLKGQTEKGKNRKSTKDAEVTEPRRDCAGSTFK